MERTARSTSARTASSATSAARTTSTRSRCKPPACSAALDILINNASSLGLVPLSLLADTQCEALEKALDVNLIGPFRLTKALLGALAASARERRGAVVVNISSDAAVNPYPTWGAYGASKAALKHMTAIWGEETAADGVRLPLVRSRATWTRRCTRWRCPTPIRRR